MIGTAHMGSGLSPSSLCVEAAKTIQELVQAFSRLYTLRRAPAFLSHILTTTCIVLLTISRDREVPTTASTSSQMGLMPEDFSASISYAIGSLAEMAVYHKGAQQELLTIQQLVRDIST